jgi:hypothetical protein
MTGRRDLPANAPGRAVLEVLLTAVLFAAAGAWPAPDVNEAVYLTKARHQADPAWGRGDFFLETPDAHGIFYLVIGPLAAALPLEQAAWIGRTLGWLALAAGFRAAVVPLLGKTSARLTAAAVFSLAVRFTTVAGEWVIGGCEAKVFAWALVLAAIGAAAAGRFARGWLLAAAGTAFHPVVGGWALVALLVARLSAPQAWGGSPPAGRRGAAALVLIAGLAVAAPGVLPALGLNAGATAAERAEAATIYVVERLPHHLLPRTFAGPLVARHLLAVAVWWLLDRLLPPTGPRRRVAAVAAAALGISLVGLAISLAEPLAPAAVCGLLRFYWFRLADVVVPFVLAVAAAGVLGDDVPCRAVFPVRPAIVRGVAAALVAVDLWNQTTHWPLPGRGLAARADAAVKAPEWEAVCDWVRDHAPADAVFLTPRGAASFIWRTGRREVVAWKNSPQDAASLVAWRRRMTDCFSRDGGMVALERSTADLGVERLREVAARYGADHAIVPIDACGAESLPFERPYENAAYAVVRIGAGDVVRGPRPAAPP